MAEIKTKATEVSVESFIDAVENPTRREDARAVCAMMARIAFVAAYASAFEGKRDTVHLFRARAAGEARADGIEVSEARFFPLDRLPPTLSPATARRIAEHRGIREPSATW